MEYPEWIRDLLAERSAEEGEHFRLRWKVTWVLATRPPQFFPPRSEGGLFGAFLSDDVGRSDADPRRN